MNELPEKDNILDVVVNAEEETASTVFSDPAEHKGTQPERGKKRLLPAIIAAVLSVCLLAGGTVAVIKLVPEREDTSSTPSVEEITVLDLDTDELASVTVTNGSGTFKLYSEEVASEDDDEDDTSSSEPEYEWYLDGYEREVISSSSVSGIVSSAAYVSASREVTAKTAAECGLESPALRADFVKRDGTELSLLIGNSSPDSTGIYVKLSTDDKIYINDASIDLSLEFDALSLAATDAISGVEVTDDMSDYTDDDDALTSFDTITLSGTKFPEKLILAPNTDENLSDYAAYMTLAPTKRIADNVDGIFEFFKSGATVSGAYSFDTSAAGRKGLGLDSPDLVAEIKIGSYTQSYSFKQQEDGDYAVWYDGCKLIKKISASTLEFIGYTVNDYYSSWVCLQSINELSGFTLKTAEKTYSFGIAYDDSEDAEETYVITYNGEKLTAENFQSFYQECISLSCTDYTVDEANNGAAEVTMVFTYSDTSRADTVVEFVKSGAAKYQYSIGGIKMGKINSSALNKIVKYAEKVANNESIG